MSSNNEKMKDLPPLDPKDAERFVVDFDELIIEEQEEEQPKPPATGEEGA